MGSSLVANCERLSPRDLIRAARVSAGLAVIGLESFGWKGGDVSHVTSHRNASIAPTFHNSKV